MDPDDINELADMLTTLLCMLPPHKRVQSTLDLLSPFMQRMPSHKLHELKDAITGDPSLPHDHELVVAILEVIEGQLALRAIGAAEEPEDFGATDDNN